VSSTQKRNHYPAGYSHVVDIYNGFNGGWTTANLSVARQDLVATSLEQQGLVLFAGGQTGMKFH
jgi:hypothetical protein